MEKINYIASQFVAENNKVWEYFEESALDDFITALEMARKRQRKVEVELALAELQPEVVSKKIEELQKELK